MSKEPTDFDDDTWGSAVAILIASLPPKTRKLVAPRIDEITACIPHDAPLAACLRRIVDDMDDYDRRSRLGERWR